MDQGTQQSDLDRLLQAIARGETSPLEILENLKTRQVEREARNPARRPDQVITEPDLDLTSVNDELNAIFNSVDVGIAYIHDRQIVRCNRKLAEIFGYQSDELLGKPTRLWYPDDETYQRIGAGVASHVAERKTYQQDLQLVRKDGSTFWCRLKGLALDNKDLDHGVLGIFQDISHEREAAEAARLAARQTEAYHQELAQQAKLLKLMMQRLQLATEAADIGIWHWDFADKVLDFDERMCEIYELDQSQRASPLYYEFLRSRIHPDDLADTEAALMAAINEDTPFKRTFRIVLPSGRVRFIHAGSVMKHDAEGNPSGMIGINRDMTEYYEDQARLRAARDASEVANQAKSAFLANMSHEIKTPMNAIMGLSSLLLDSELTAQQRDYLEKVHRASQTLLNLINDILDYSKLEAGDLHFEKAPFRLSDVIQNTINLFSTQTRDKGLDLVMELSPTLPRQVIGDSLRLGQVFNHLVGNAIKFTEHGKICIKAENLADTDPTAQPAVTLRFSISDTGPGIAPEYLRELFSPFSQADNSIRRRFNGTGLGLAIAQKLVALMGGKISVISAVGQGSTFSFTARFESCQAAAADQPGIASPALGPPPATDPAESLAALRDAEILLVEDSPLNQLVLSRFLTKMHCQVTLAENGEQALSWIKQKHFDAVLMDLRMPVMDGYDATRHIRAWPTCQNLPIIATTASTLPEVILACREAGISDCLAKPIETHALAACLLRWIKPGPKPTDTPAQAVPADETRHPLTAHELETLEPLLMELRQLLAENMLSAKKIATQIETLLTGKELASAFVIVSSQIRNMQFEQATLSLNTFKTLLDLPTKPAFSNDKDET